MSNKHSYILINNNSKQSYKIKEQSDSLFTVISFANIYLYKIFMVKNLQFKHIKFRMTIK